MSFVIDRRSVPIFLAGFLLAAPSLSAQRGDERAVIDSIFAELGSEDSTKAAPAPSRCAPYAGTLGRFCRALIDLDAVESTPDGGKAFSVEMQLRRVVDEKPDWATAWYALGIARLQLTRSGVLAREGVRQPLGVSAEAGAGLALVTALQVEDTFLVAAEALALAPLPREGASQLGERRDALRGLRHRLPLSPAARLSTAIVERESGSLDTAIVMYREALAAGADSGIAHLELARVLHKAGRPVEGRAALIAGAALSTTEAARQRYREELSWIASPAEMAAWDSLPDGERSRWLEAFWVGREVREGRGPGERMIEHYRRYETAMHEFLIRVPQKGRQRVRSVALAVDLLDPGASDVTGRGGASTRQGWNPGTEAGASQEAAERSRQFASGYESTAGHAAPFRVAGITQDVLDDRGVIWIRHGAPDERTHTSGGTVMEAWRYDRAPEDDLILFFAEADFDGQSGATVLIPNPASAGGLAINQLCGNARGMCDDLLRFSQPEGVVNRGFLVRRGSLGPPAPLESQPLQTQTLASTREDGIRQITRGVTSDDHRRTFATMLRPSVQIYGLDRAGGGAPRVLASFAIPGERLVGTQPPEAGGRTVYSVRIQVMTTQPSTGRRFDLDTLRHFATPAPLAAGQFLTATVELPIPEGDHDVTVVITQADDRGALSHLAAVSAPRSDGALSLSSLVLGREGSGTSWSSGSRMVALHPLNAFTRQQEVALYYQLNGLRPGTTYRTTVELFPAGDDDAPAALSIGFSEEAESRFAEVQRTIGLRNLKPGSYRLRLTVVGGGATVREAGQLVVVE